MSNTEYDEFCLLHLNRLLAKLENRKLSDSEKDKKKVLVQIKRWEKKHGVLNLLMEVVGLESWELTYYFEYQGRMCLVIRRNDSVDGFYHNGYVEVSQQNKGKKCEVFEEVIETVSFEAIGWEGDLDQYDPLPEECQGKWYFGFHNFLLSSDGRKYRGYGSFQNVLETTKELAEEMVAKNV